MITIASQIQPASPPSRLRCARRFPSGVPCLTSWPLLLLPVVSVVATTGSFQLAGSGSATKPAEQDGDQQTDLHEDEGDHAGGPHQVGLEAAMVHVQGENPGGVTGAAGREHEDEVEERQ